MRRADFLQPALEEIGDRLHYEFARYLKIRAAYGATWSSDGLHIAFLTDITGVPQAWEVPVEGGWPEQLTFHEERISGIHYSPKENRLLFSMDAGGNERLQLFALDGFSGEEWDLTRAPDAIHYFGGFSPDGEQIAYTATRRNGTDFDVFVQALGESDEPEVVWETSGYHTVSCWAPDGSFLIVSRHHSNLNNDLYRLDLANAGGEPTLLTPHEGDARFRGVRVTPDVRHAFLATDRDGDFVRLARLDLLDGGSSTSRPTTGTSRRSNSPRTAVGSRSPATSRATRTSCSSTAGEGESRVPKWHGVYSVASSSPRTAIG